MFERGAMNLVLGRLVGEGLAPPGERPIDFADITPPGAKKPTDMLLLTDAAIYICHKKSPGGTRLSLNSIGEVQVLPYVPATVHVTIRDLDGSLFHEAAFPSNLGFVEMMRQLAAQAPGLPGLKPARELLGVEPIVHLSGGLRHLALNDGAPLDCRERAALYATETGLAVATPRRGVAFACTWEEITRVAFRDLENGRRIALEIASATGRVGLFLPGFGLTAPTDADAFFTNETVRAHVHVTRTALGGSDGSTLLDAMAEFDAARRAGNV